MQRGIDSRTARAQYGYNTAMDRSGWKQIASINTPGVNALAISRFPVWANSMRFHWSMVPNPSNGQPGLRFSTVPDVYHAGATDYGFELLGYDTAGTGTLPIGQASFAPLSVAGMLNTWLCNGMVLMSGILTSGTTNSAIEVFSGGANGSGNGQWTLGLVWRTFVGPIIGVQFFTTSLLNDMTMVVEASP